MKHFLTFATAVLVASTLRAATPDELFQHGKRALSQNDAEKAASIFEQLVKAKPNVAEYHFWLGRAYGAEAQKASLFSAPGLAIKTRDEFERSVELDPKSTDGRFGLLEYYLQAPSFMGGSEEKAREQAEAIRKLDAMDGHRAFATIAQRTKKPDLARKEFMDAVREQPNSAEAHHLLGGFLMQEKNFKQAADEYETVVKLDPNFMWGWFRIGQIAALSSNNATRGEEALRKYLGHTPADDEPPLARAWYWLGRIKENEGRKDEARQMYQTSLKLTPGAKDVTEALKRVS